MINVNRLNDFIAALQLEVNNLIDGESWVLSEGLWIDDDHWIDDGKVHTNVLLGKVIDHVIISPTESHLIKKIADKKGIVLAVKLPDADAVIESVDNYSDMNHMLLFLLEKVDHSAHKNAIETAHYAKIQAIMKLVKEYILHHGLNSNVFNGDETLDKPFHSEWEYNTFGGYNGLSVSFDLANYDL